MIQKTCNAHSDCVIVYKWEYGESQQCPVCTMITDLLSDLAIVKSNRDALDNRCRELEAELKEAKDTIMEMGG